MKYIREIPDVDEIKNEYSLTQEQKEKRKTTLQEIKNVLSGVSKKKLLCIGPCSADREDAVLEYMNRLSKIKEQVENVLLIVPRVYTAKPRTNGLGYKGMIHSPDAENGHDNLYRGIFASRKLHLHVIQETGLFSADEILYTESICFLDDLLAYVAVGARSVEDQQHRLVTSGLDMPVGMKNPTSGNLQVLLNAIKAAQTRQSLIYRGWECQTEGNLYAHAILRGYTDIYGGSHPNYHYDDLVCLHDKYVKQNLKNIGVIVDCNHENSRKRYDEQGRIAREVLSICKTNPTLNRFVKGFMIESYLVDGAQVADEGIFGKSITDPCLGWSKTEKLIMTLADLCC